MTVALTSNRLLCVFALVFALVPPVAMPSLDAQESRQEQRLRTMRERMRSRKKGEHERDHDSIRGPLRELMETARRSTVRILGDRAKIAYGAVIDERHVVTKASQLQGVCECRFFDGQERRARVVGVSERSDLALLELEGRPVEGIAPIAWREGDEPPIGSFLATAGIDDDAIGLGVVSVATRPLKERGVMGIRFDENSPTPLIGRVFPDTGAARAGLKAGDLIALANGVAVPTREAVVEILGRLSPGDELPLQIRRGDDEIDVTVRLGSARAAFGGGRRNDRMNQLAGELSDRRSDFPAVLQHDTYLFPDQCGGPIVDLDGRAVGLNIARAGRVDSFALPASVVEDIVSKLAEGGHPPTAEFLERLKPKVRRRRI